MLIFFISLVALGCGGSASENNTYIVQASATAVTSPCTYTVCKCSTNICRIRYDFTVNIFSLLCSFLWIVEILKKLKNQKLKYFSQIAYRRAKMEYNFL